MAAEVLGLPAADELRDIEALGFSDLDPLGDFELAGFDQVHMRRLLSFLKDYLATFIEAGFEGVLETRESSAGPALQEGQLL